jgi:hypothetical protein
MYFKHLRVELTGGMGNPTDMLFTMLYPTEWEYIRIEVSSGWKVRSL